MEIFMNNFRVMFWR